ncbi:transposase InsO family protein [Paraburkholderia sp. 35.1]
MRGSSRVTPGATRPLPAHALSPQERANVLRVASEPRFADMPPARIVPMLADEGVYIASESTFARVLREHGQMTRRGRARTPSSARPPTTHVATAPRQVWCWDMTYLPATVTGRWFHLYMILDLYSRKIVGWEVHDSDAAEHAAHLVRRTALSEGIAVLETRPVLHGDNGATLKATTVLAMLHWLGVKPSYSRPPGQRRQRLRRGAVPNREVPAGVSGHRLRGPERCSQLGCRLRAVVQLRASS